MCERVKRKSEGGFSILEMMIAIVVMTVILGVVFSFINDAIKTNTGEQAKLDQFDQAREFMDQMTRDLRTVGYPNSRNFGAPYGTYPVVPASATNAIGLIKVSWNELCFEAAVNGVSGSTAGTAQVSVIHYYLSADGTSLYRSEIPKTDGADPTDSSYPLTLCSSSNTPQMEIQGVKADSNNPIFIAYLPDGTPEPLVDFVNPKDCNGSPVIAEVNSLRVNLTVQSKYPDPKTGAFPVASLVSSMKLNNCSQAGSNSGQLVSCVPIPTSDCQSGRCWPPVCPS